MSESLDQSGDQARRSVWTLAIAGSAIGAVFFAVIAIVLMDLRTRRALQEETHRVSSLALSEADSEAACLRDRVVAMLHPQKDLKTIPRECASGGTNALSNIGERMLVVGAVRGSERLTAIATQMGQTLQNAQDWREAFEGVRLEQANTYVELQDAFNKLKGKIAEAEGRTRLDLAMQIRRSRRDKAPLASVATEHLFTALSKQAGLSAYNADLLKLETIAERLLGETDPDRIADLRDNQLKPLTDRLSAHTGAIKIDDEWNEILDGVLGEGFRLDDAHQTIHVGDGGLLKLRERVHVLDARLEQLLVESTREYDSWHHALAEVEIQEERAIADAAIRAEATLFRAGVIVVALGVGSIAWFYYLAHRIAGTIDRQIGTIDKVSRDLAQAQKLESVGQLAAGIAHEINTPMQYIHNNISYLSSCIDNIFTLLKAYDNLLTRTDTPIAWCDRLNSADEAKRTQRLDRLREQVPQAISDSLVGATRVLEIVRAMKTFSHPGSDEFMPTNINDSIKSTVAITRNRWKYHSELVTNLDETLPVVTVLPAEINQVLLNLVVNAGDAVAEKYDGTEELGQITVSTKLDGDHAVIEVADTGAGIPDSVRDKIFEPFFTTKDVGKGTGQGLAICYNAIVVKHHGALSVESTPGEGTTFRVRLPLVQPSTCGGSDDPSQETGNEADAPVEALV